MKRLVITAVAVVATLIGSLTATAADNTSRFATGDKTLTPAEVSAVYYAAPSKAGFTASPDYSRINELRAEWAYDKLLAECKALLAKDPTQLHPLFLLYAAAVNTGDTATKDLAQWQVTQLCDAIFASGKGVLEESPYKVVRSADILPFLNNYLYVKDVLGSSRKGRLTAALVNWDDNEIYFFFDVADGR